MFTILIPTHNEENRIEETLESLFFFLTKNYQSRDYEVLIIDDGSDRTQKKAREFKHPGSKIRLFHYAHRLGKGGALIEGFKKARGELIITYDADGAIPPREIPKMLVELKKYDIVIGSRKHPDSDIYGHIPFRRQFASFSFNLLVNLLFNLRIGDTQCGFKGIRKKAAMRLAPLMKLKGFEWDVELLVKGKKNNLRMKEIGIEWHHKKEGKVVVGDTTKMLAGIIKLKAEELGFK